MQPTRVRRLRTQLAERLLVIDGAMGTMIQQLGLTEGDYRGVRFAGHPTDLFGNNDLLCLTQPEVIRRIHASYVHAGAQVIETNTFNANRISQADYGLADLAPDLCREGARIARATADELSTNDRPVFVAGVLGPTSRTASLSPDVEDPGARNIH